MKHCRPVAVTGIGCLSAAGLNLSANMTALYKGVRQAAPPTRFETDHEVVYPVFEVFEDRLEWPLVTPETVSRTSMLGLAAALEALDDAGWTPAALGQWRVGVCMGTTVGSAMNNEAFYREYKDGLAPEMDVIDKFLRSNPADVIARALGLNGPCQTIVNACSSGTDAIGEGAAWIRAGLCDMVIAGGADELCRVTYNGFISLMITDETVCKPFDRERKGLNLGEGAAALLLESKAMAAKRNRAPRAYVLGYGSASDGYHLTAPRPDGKGLKNAISDALAQGGLASEDIAFVNAHGTATPDNDRVEGNVLKEILPDIPFLSTKGYTGHTLGAAGAIEAAFTVACLEASKLPANAGFKTEDPDIGISPVKGETVVSGKAAVSESLAFGGHNAALLLGLPDMDRGKE